MNITNLPDDCLLCIFDYFQDFRDLLNSAQVCSKWRELVPTRYKKIKNLIFWEKEPNLIQPDQIYTDKSGFIEKINVSEVFPNLKLLESKKSQSKCLCQVIANIMATGNPISGIIASFRCRYMDEIYKILITNDQDKFFNCNVDLDQQIVKYCGNLQLLDTDCDSFLHSYFIKFKFGQNLKQFGGVHVIDVNIFLKYAQQMPNLECVHLNNPFAFVKHDGPMFLKVKQLHILCHSYNNNPLQFVSYFPNLQILHLDVKTKDENTILQKCTINHNVQEVSLKVTGRVFGLVFNTLGIIKDISTQFPNCKRLMISSSPGMTNDNPIEIIEMLPKLISLRLENSELENQEVMDKVNQYCLLNNRKIFFEIRRIEEENPSITPNTSYDA